MAKRKKDEAEVDVGLPIPIPSGGYLNEQFATNASPIDPRIILNTPVQTGMNAPEGQAMDPLTMMLLSQGVDFAAEETGLKKALKESPPGKMARGLLSAIGDALIPSAQAAEVPPMPPVQAGFQPTTSVVAQDATPMQRSAMNYVPDDQIPMEGRRLPTREQILVRQDWEGPGRGLAQGDTLPDGTMPVNMDGVRNVPQITPKASAAAENLIKLGANSMSDAGQGATNEIAKKDPPPKGGFFDTIKDFLGDEESMATLAIAFNSMRLNPDTSLAAAMEKRIERADTRRKANRTADYLESIGQKQAADLIRKNPSMAADILKEYTMGGTAAFRTLEARARAAGLKPGTPEYQDFMRTGGQSFAGGLQIGSIPAGYQVVEREGGVRLEPIPGGEAERKQAEEARQRQTQQELAGRAGGVVFEDIGRLEKLVSEDPILNPVLGVTGAVASFIPGTNRVDAESLAQTIRANIGFDRLQQMREASPTGGALGQVSNQELSTLQSVLGNLSLSQSQDQVLQNLDRLKKIYADILKKAQAYPNASEFGFSPASQEANTNDPLGIL